MAKNNVARAAIHAAAQTSLHPAQVNENTRDGWDKEKYDNKNLDTSHHYDVTRKNLNFMVDADGIKPLSATNTEKMYNRYIDRLRELEFKAYDPDATNQPNSYIDWVFSGDHDVMHKMAFGDQDVALDLSRDNSHIFRMPKIEEFAKAVYGFACQKFGAENVVGAEVHLDETTPHIHINVIPTAMRMQRGRATSLYVHKDDPNNTITSKEYKNLSKTARKNWIKGQKLERTQRLCVSFSGMVGENRIERGRYLKQFHTDFFEQVGVRFGLARGREKETLSEEELKKRRHKSAAELEAERQQQIKEAQELDAAIQGKKKEKKNLTDDNARLVKKNKSLKAENHEAQNKLNNVLGEIFWNEEERDKVIEEKDNAEKEVSNLNSKKGNLQKDVTSLQSRQDALDSTLENKKNLINEADDKRKASEAEARRAGIFEDLSQVKKKFFTVNLEYDKKVNATWKDIQKVLKENPPYFNRDEWMTGKRNKVNELLRTLVQDVKTEQGKDYENIRWDSEALYNGYIDEMIKRLDDDAKNFKDGVKNAIIRDALVSLSKAYGDDNLGKLANGDAQLLGEMIKDRDEQHTKVIADYLSDAMNNKYSSNGIIDAAKKWDRWKFNYVTRAKDPKTVYDSLQKLVGKFIDSLYEEDKGLQKSFDSLCNTVKENDDDFLWWDKNKVTELANAVYFLSLPYIEKGSNEKARKSLNLLINNSEIAKREKSEEVKRSQAKIEYEGRSFYIPEKIKSTMHDIIYDDLPAPGEYEGEQEDPYPNGFTEVVDKAVATAAAIFVGYIDAATTMAPSSDGGGGGSTGGWRDKDDEDGRARKAAHLAATMHTPKHSPKISRGRGLH